MEAAHHALIDPLIEPDPSDETGLNSHFRSTFAPAAPITPPGSAGDSKGPPSIRVQNTGSSVETNPFRRRSRASSESKGASASVSQVGRTTPQSRRKKNFQGADVIDRLDKASFGQYHHEGPYDAASIARNRDTKYSPLAAVKDSNEEALKATPRENIIDSVQRHRPLEGVAVIPPGMTDRFGRVLDYEEGADLQREPGGDYRRWPGVEYHPDDLKGKGEPSFTIEKALKDHKRLGDTGTEMTSRSHRTRSVGHTEAPGLAPPVATDPSASGVGRSNTTGRSVGGAIRKRIGSIRRRKQEVEV
ncbi:hypothetical protein ACET3X_006541 [Alternaria dauci]|uniref:Pal1 cell morphology protein n=1 Tax=Alternaria dauci TaxID=48095 RepID=A0ABR3UED2_9PLEO